MCVQSAQLGRERVRLLAYMLGLVDGDCEDGPEAWTPIGLEE